MVIKNNESELKNIHMTLNYSGDKKLKFGVCVIFFGDAQDPFTDIEKEAYKVIIAEAVHRNMIQGQKAELFTMSFE